MNHPLVSLAVPFLVAALATSAPAQTTAPPSDAPAPTGAPAQTPEAVRTMPHRFANPGTLPRLSITADTFAGLPRRTVRVTEKEDGVVEYSGVDLGTLLAKRGAPMGKTLRGPAVADYVVVRAADGYRAVFALCELDPSLADKVVLLADRRNGAPMDAALGPFRIVVPDEKEHKRWVREVTEVEVQTAAPSIGQRRYPN